jgi:DNA-binding HxlR family transcriptional regulator
MGDTEEDENSSVVTIKGYDHSKELGRILSHEGRIQILFALQKEPKIFSDLETKVEIKGTTFDKALRELRKECHVIRKSKTFAKNRETSQYILEPIGRELLRFIETYERTIAKPKPEQEMLEVENKGSVSLDKS